MPKQRYLIACAFSVLACGIAAPAAAQLGATAPADQVDQTPATQVSDIIITGSIIRGTPEDSALPVNVITDDELSKQGSPSAVELLKALPTSSAVLGDSNQFDSRSQGAEGIATANLRGLSAQRTLVLLNNRRLVTAGNGIPAVDINLIPAAAIGRIEVLKDGAAATYGSEAIAGVVNFITRTDQEGFRAAGSYKFVKGSDGDIDGSVSYGHTADHWRFLVAASFQKRGELSTQDRSFAIQPYAVNPQGGWTGGGNPATFLGLAASGAPTTGLTADASCAPLGGYVGGNGRCYTHYTPYDNIADLEKRGTAFIDFEADLTDSVKLEITGLYGRSTVPHYSTSPSYILTQAPSIASKGGVNQTPFVTGFYVPSTNPGFIAYNAATPFPTGTTGAVFPLLLFRPYLTGGNPATLSDSQNSGSASGLRKSESARATIELSGKIGSSINWNVGGTYHDYNRYIDGFDEFGDRVQLALRGLGGFNCTATTPGTNGCQYLNPFGNAVTVNAATGEKNPMGNSALANSADLSRWLFVKSNTVVDSQLYVADAGLSGSTEIKLPGGNIAFGIGAQYRYNTFDTRYGANNNVAVNPCRDSPLTGNANPAACSPLTSAVGTPSPPNGALGFLGTGRNQYLQGGVYALFGEVQLPVFDSFNIQAAARYENYGGGVGSTFNPQVRARWQVTDFLAIRGGYGTTFRAPTLANISTGFITALQLIGSTFTPVDINGNPSLKPEKSKNYSGGILLKAGGFNASVDYFRYALTDVIVSDPLTAMVATLFPTGMPNTCATNPALADRFTFTTGPGRGGCSAATTVASVARVNTFLQNGATQQNSGLDFAASYRGTDILGPETRFGVGVDATLTLNNKISDISVSGVRVAQAYDGVGLLNYQSTLYPVPKWKGQAYIDIGFGPVDARLTGYYVDGLHDQRFDTRTGPFAPDPSLRNPDGTIPKIPISLLTGADPGSFTTVDFNLQIRIQRNITLTGTVINIFDAQPPFAREDYNYEPFVGNPFGRQFKIGVATKF
ncbi:MAG: TonB-dependent receptor [Pseudomonadota bacterium]|nr:TonB-dependent receptor [Pseudomonadota bacterium]